MQLIRKQVEYIEEAITSRKSNDTTLRKGYLESRNGQATDNEAPMANVDIISETALRINRQELNNLIEILSSSETEIIDESSLTSVEIGTTFTVRFADENEDEEVTLVENLIGLEGKAGYTSIESPFGKSVHHKEVGDTFAYTVSVGGRNNTLTGSVTSIGNEKETEKTIIKK